MSIQEYISEEKISMRVRELGSQISQDYAGEDLLVICILKGAFIFCADLVRQIKVPTEVEFMKISTYGNAQESSGEFKIELDLSTEIEGKNVLIVEDIVDTGFTLKSLMKYLENKNAKTIKLASLLHKPSRSVHEIKINYLGFTIEDQFVIGHGLDFAGKYRELPYIGVLNEDNC